MEDLGGVVVDVEAKLQLAGGVVLVGIARGGLVDEGAVGDVVEDAVVVAELEGAEADGLDASAAVADLDALAGPQVGLVEEDEAGGDVPEPVQAGDKEGQEGQDKEAEAGGEALAGEGDEDGAGGEGPDEDVGQGDPALEAKAALEVGDASQAQREAGGDGQEQQVGDPVDGLWGVDGGQEHGGLQVR